MANLFSPSLSVGKSSATSDAEILYLMKQCWDIAGHARSYHFLSGRCRCLKRYLLQGKTSLCWYAVSCSPLIAHAHLQNLCLLSSRVMGHAILRVAMAEAYGREHTRSSLRKQACPRQAGGKKGAWGVADGGSTTQGMALFPRARHASLHICAVRFMWMRYDSNAADSLSHSPHLELCITLTGRKLGLGRA